MKRRAPLAPLLAFALLACSSRPRTRDVVARRAGDPDAGPPPESTVAPPPTPQPVAPPPAATKLRLVTRASCRALAIDDARVYFGNNDDDAVFSVKKEGGEPVRLARRAPVAGALAIEGGHLTWIATPGDIVLRVPVGGGNPTTLRERGIFADVAMQGSDVYIAEIVGAGGDITRVSGATAARIASVEGGPRAIAVDAKHVYVATSSKLVRAPRERGEVETLATGPGFDSPVLDDEAVYAVAATAVGTRQLLRIAKSGGEPKAIASDVRAAPIAEGGGEILYFDASRPALLAEPSRGGEPRLVAQDDALARPSAIAADATSIYVATGEREDGAIHAVPRGKR